MDNQNREQETDKAVVDGHHVSCSAAAAVLPAPEADTSIAPAATICPSTSAPDPHSDTDTLPAPISQLLTDVSIEYRRGGGLIGSVEEKKTMQERIKQHVLRHLTQNQTSLTPTSAVPPTPADPKSVASGSTCDESSASSSSLPPLCSKSSLLRHLSEAAASGLISHAFKDEIKHMLLAPRMHVLSTTRLVRRVSAQKEHENASADDHAASLEQARSENTTPQTDPSAATASSDVAAHPTSSASVDSSPCIDATAGASVEVVSHQIDTSGLDADQCLQLQSDEREAIIAIYGEENVTCDEKMIEEETEVKEEAEPGYDDDEEDEENEDSSDNNSEDGAEDAKEDTENGETIVDDTAAISASSSSPAPIHPAPASQKCSVVSVRVFPYPAQGPERNAVSALVRFTLPPFYPYLRPAFDVMSMDGEGVTSADGVMLDAAISQAIQAFYEVEPVPIAEGEDSPPVRLFDLITSAQDFLCEYQSYLEDAAYHAQMEDQRKEEARRQREEREKKERIRRLQEEHARAYFEAEKRLKSPTINDRKVVEKEAGSGNSERLDETLEQMVEVEHGLDKFEDDAAGAGIEGLEADTPSSSSSTSVDIKRSDFVRVCDGLVPPPEQIVEHIIEQDPNFLGKWAYHECLTLGMHDTTWLKQKRIDHLFASRMAKIVSPFLLYRFRKLQQLYRSMGIPWKASIAFHGTLPHWVGSIRQHGLIVPGQKIGDRNEVLNHRTDAGWYGRGIYLSPDLGMSLSYASRFLSSTFVCLVLRGRVSVVEYCEGCAKLDGVDSHSNALGTEWVIFNSAAVLPIYLLSARHTSLAYDLPPPPPPASEKLSAAKAAKIRQKVEALKEKGLHKPFTKMMKQKTKASNRPTRR